MGITILYHSFYFGCFLWEHFIHSLVFPDGTLCLYISNTACWWCCHNGWILLTYICSHPFTIHRQRVSTIPLLWWSSGFRS